MVLEASDSQIFILDKFGKDNPLYSSWASLLTPANYVAEYDAGWIPPRTCALLITAQHYQATEISILRRAVEKDIPTLVIADGILEYRNTWVHPDSAPGCIFQPVIGQKIACLGRSQARILESWGNLGKCEIVGAPHLDPLIGGQPRKRQPDETFRFLVMTAKTPAFTLDQTALVKRSLQDLKFWFSQHRYLNGTPIEPVWRLTQNLDKEIGVENQFAELIDGELAELLGRVDAVITTPSTTMLQSMLHGLPVTLLDYNNCPHYVPAAWAITAPRHIDQVLPELLTPPTAKMLYQDTVLHDALECHTSAAPRMVQLIEEMLRIAHDCRSQNKPILFPRRILTDNQDGHHIPEERFDMRLLYPGHPVFTQMDRVMLQVEIGHLAKEMNSLRKIIKADNFLKQLSRSFPGPRKLLRLWREFQQRTAR